VEVPDEFNAGLATRKVVYLPVPHNLPNHYFLDREACTRCGECEKICPTNAITLQAEDGPSSEDFQKEVGSVVLAAGFGSFDPRTGKNTYGYKEALLTKERSNGTVDTAVFYMDMRTFGKDFQRYRDGAEKDQGIRFVRSRVHSVEPDEHDKGALRLSYSDVEGRMQDENFDLVALATGQRPTAGTDSLAKATGVSINEWGFCRLNDFSSSRTARDGVFIAGSFAGLTDISESVIQANSASLAASALLRSKGGSLAAVTAEPEPPSRNVARELPRIAVALCTCGTALPESLDLSQLTGKLAALPSVKEVLQTERVCTRGGWDELQEKLKNGGANRIVIGSCQPYVYARKLKELGKAVGLNPNLMTVVDLRTAIFPGREGDPGQLTDDILAVLKMAVAKQRSMDPVSPSLVEIVPKALVVGGGIAGMTAALAIADHGFEVSLVEHSSELGGNLRKLYRTLEGYQPQELLEKTISRVEKHPQIEIYRNSRLLHSQGRVGHFLSTIEQSDGTGATLEHGVTILATGGAEASTTSYAYGQSEAIVTQHELEEKLQNVALKPAELNVVAMIQCVGSREEPRNYCSRICCASALKNALYLKEQNPELDVYIFYRDLMAYGFLETYYTQARRAGVFFIQYQVDDKPRVSAENGRVSITARDPILGRELVLEPDLLVLSTGIVPGSHQGLAEIFGVDVNGDGFLQEADSKWRPVDFIKEGVFLCGIAHSPRSIGESMATAEAAAQRALGFLARKEVAGSNIVAEVRHNLCSQCERCMEACPYGARFYDDDEERVLVNELACQGCGSCAAVCPNSASVLRGFKDQQIHAILDAALDDI
jgi:heterodisulfide reductase subunit A2